MYDSTGLYRTEEVDNQVIETCLKLKLDQDSMRYAMRFLGSKSVDNLVIEETKKIMLKAYMSKKQKERNELRKKVKKK